ncbi:ROK family transcriptional regulator [Microbacterium sp. zg.Y1090]|uniref:ROK family transcriptional regulator n=1 Tax=Microbacterium TaxID=33882 RepID=UPI00214D018F|nr:MULTISPECIES: ROK family transcriptional regulator [unclassified Microbacterium]MCR2811568.1 ROK family transcriptional regulator [Microbacterium sp. zg.Y1084]MCR2819010.1 ROK family transcriptional regulator [Microbacterium sp. zg.Y1090]MDL5487660.1 ROK family transcriptional regulator [Microbacterium sp. zg-Y1211]WIM27315.1 ROK family transcriptional regulator [Microbacterium sp. zg-Y1090]
MAPQNARTPSDDDVSRSILDLVARGEARSRVDLATELGVAASTVGVRVKALTDSGLLHERGDGPSRGGRRPRILAVPDDAGVVLSADLGGQHARIGIHRLSGALVRTRAIPVELAAGPEPTLAAIAAVFDELAAGDTVRAIGMSLPGPVDIAAGTVHQPSRMPGWPGFGVGAHLRDRYRVTVAVDNDANLAALGEHRARFGAAGHSITVKAGTAIGSGIIVGGQVHRGATSAAGDITHTRIDGSGDIPCSCGNTGCLETVASGASLVRQMRERGRTDITSTTDVLALARDADPEATTLVRTAGTHLGQALSGVVNFFNPAAVFLTGSMSASEPFLAAVRSRVYEACHPLATQRLRIEAAQTGADAILLGAARWALDNLELPAPTG